MAIETTEGGGFVVQGHADIMRVHAIRVAHAAALEINTGLKVGHGSIVAACNRISGGAKRTKKGALRDLVAFMVANHGYELKPGSVAKAVAK